MSLLSAKLKSKSTKGKPMIGSVCVERTMNCRMKNQGQENLLREKTEDYEKFMNKERKTTRQEQNRLRVSIGQIGKVSMATDDWLDKNRRRCEDWKMREREKIANKHSRVGRAYRCPSQLKTDLIQNNQAIPEVAVKIREIEDMGAKVKTRRCKTAPPRRQYLMINTLDGAEQPDTLIQLENCKEGFRKSNTNV